MTTPRTFFPGDRTLKTQIAQALPFLAAYDSLDVDWLIQDHLYAVETTAGGRKHPGHDRIATALIGLRPFISATNDWFSASPVTPEMKAAAAAFRRLATTSLPPVAAEVRAAFAAFDCSACPDLAAVRAGAPGPYHRRASRYERNERAKLRKSFDESTTP